MAINNDEADDEWAEPGKWGYTIEGVRKMLAYEDMLTLDFSPKTEVIRFLLSRIDFLESELKSRQALLDRVSIQE